MSELNLVPFYQLPNGSALLVQDPSIEQPCYIKHAVTGRWETARNATTADGKESKFVLETNKVYHIPDGFCRHEVIVRAVVYNTYVVYATNEDAAESEAEQIAVRETGACPDDVSVEYPADEDLE